MFETVGNHLGNKLLNIWEKLVGPVFAWEWWSGYNLYSGFIDVKLDCHFSRQQQIVLLRPS
jgi:hypothetical protein